MKLLFGRFDPRLAAELASQKRSIILGLACVFLTSLLTGVTVLMLERAVRALQEATPIPTNIMEGLPGEEVLVEKLGVSREKLREALRPQMDLAKALPPPADLARSLQVPQERVEEAYQELARRPQETAASRSSRQDQALLQLSLLCGGVVLIFGLKYFLTRGQTYYLSRASSRLASNLRQKLFGKLQRLPISYFTEKRTGSIQSVLTNDVGVYQGAVNIIRDSIDGPVKAGVSLIAIFFISWPLALVSLLFMPPIALFIHRNGQKMKVAQKSVQNDLADLAALSTEALTGARVIKAFSAEGRMEGMFGVLVEKQYQSQMKAVRRFAQLRPMVELIGAVSLALILVICGFMAREGLLQISQIVALTLALDNVNQGARSFANVVNTYSQVQAAADRIYQEVLDVPDEDHAKGTGRTLESYQGRITFDEVSFTYPDGTKALDSVSFVIEPGTSLALVGPSGSGKSTIADLMLKFYEPTSGRIALDGVDYRELDTEWLRSQFGVVPQQTFLFAGAISENLRLGAPSASEEDLRKAAQAANALDFIERTELGMETLLGERGARLSGGEGQRLAIARALARDPRILILDEATSSLDAHSERVVTEALDKAMENRTTLFIAHRLTTAARATQIMMLRHGMVVETGSHEELMARGGPYSSLYQAFMAGVAVET